MSLNFLAPIEDLGPARLPLPSHDHDDLSKRDREIVRLAADKTYSAIAADLGITRGTVAGAISRARQSQKLSSFERIAHGNLVEGLSRRPSLYISHPDIRP